MVLRVSGAVRRSPVFVPGIGLGDGLVRGGFRLRFRRFRRRRVGLRWRRDLILGHFRMVAEREEPMHALHKLRKFTGWYTHGLPHGRRLRQQINSLPDVEAFLAAVEEFFDSLLVGRAA